MSLDSTAHSPRVPLIEPGTRPELRDVEVRILAERGRISPLYQVLLHSLPIAQGWEAMLTAVRNRCAVAADLRELIILRVAVLNRAPYEFEAHVPHALKAGIAPAWIDAVRTPELSPLFDDRARRVLRLTDHMTRDVQVPDAVMDEMAWHHGPTELVELVATVAAYNMVSRFLAAMKID